MLANVILIASSFLGLSAVLLGAFSGHALQPLLEANNRVATFTTANHYHFFHTLAILGVAILMKNHTASPSQLLILSASGFFIGITLFSGSLYVLALANWKFLGAVAPFGGTALIVGWGALAVYGIKSL